MSIEELRARLTAIADRLRAINTDAGDGDLTDEQRAEWDQLDAEHVERTAELERAEAAERVNQSRARWRSVNFGGRPDRTDGADLTRMGRSELTTRALGLLDDDRDEVVRQIDPAAKERLARALRTSNDNVRGHELARRMLVTETPEYRSAFMKLTSMSNPVLTPEENRAIQEWYECRAMSLSDANGGYGVPVLIDPTIILTGQGHPNPFFQIARVETITNDEWKGVTSAGVTWKFRTEAAASTDGSPTLAQPVVPAYRADGTIKYSIEIGMDYPGFAGQMSDLLAEGYSELLVDKLTIGSGSNEPTGIVTALDANASSEVTPDTDGALYAADVRKLWDQLPIRYRGNANWMMSTDVNNEVESLGAVFGSNTTTTLAQEGAGPIKGRPVKLNDYMADFTGTTGKASLMIVGDWRNFLVAQRAGMNVELLPLVVDTTTGLPTGERAIFAWARVGSDSINDNAFRMLQNQ